MSVYPPKRAVLSVVAAALLATSAFAEPSPRGSTRMAYHAADKELILFGGDGAFDTGMLRVFDTDETWAWIGTRWEQRFPAHKPSPRSAHTMVTDTMRDRIVLFGGRQQVGDDKRTVVMFNETWIYDDGDWTKLDPPNSPSPRQLAAMAYDPLRDRVVLYGGTHVSPENEVTSLYDTWEFDGTTWTQVGDTAVQVTRPLMAYDTSRDELILVGSDSSFKPHMYRFNKPAQKWDEVTPAAMPGCAADAAMVYLEHNSRIMLVGGICSLTESLIDKTWEWNGSTWAEVKTASVERATGVALGYHPLHDSVINFGGTPAFDTIPRAGTQMYQRSNWRTVPNIVRPAARSLFVFNTDPVTRTTWLFGGLNEQAVGYTRDLWGYRDGQWFFKATQTDIAQCDFPVSAFDINRSRLVISCVTGTGGKMEVIEFDGNDFKQVTVAKDKPDFRRFASMAYDETLKKVVMFGGYDGQDFKDDTWTWDGTAWTEVKKDKPNNRSSFAMWYDPLKKKTLIYGGVGRENLDERVQRYTDMWEFNGSGWKKLDVTNTPGERTNAQFVVDPATGKLLLFGGARTEITNPDKNTRRQFFDNDMWQWDGAANSWTKLSPLAVPPARGGGRIAYDPLSQKIVLFGGYGGLAFSDVWIWTGTKWEPRQEGGRRRAVGPVRGIQSPVGVGNSWNPPDGAH